MLYTDGDAYHSKYNRNNRDYIGINKSKQEFRELNRINAPNEIHFQRGPLWKHLFNLFEKFTKIVFKNMLMMVCNTDPRISKFTFDWL